MEAGNRRGARVSPQVASRPTGFVYSLASYHPVMAKPSYPALLGRPHDQLAAETRRPEVRARILTEDNIPVTQHPGELENHVPTIPRPISMTT